jgi:glycosyltransferase involved in cell wall biosynthesis
VYIQFLNDKSKNTNLDKYTTIPNGYDAIDFEKYQLIENEIFTLTYTGTISDQYNITPFLDALSQFKADKPNNPFCLQFVGSVYPNLKKELTQRNLIGNTKFSPYVPHSESIEFLEKASALLVFGPLNRHGKEGGIPAKVYEYLAARKPIIYVGKKDGFVAEIIYKTASGLAHDNNIVDIQNHITDLYQKWESNNGILPNNTKITEYSRESQAKTFANLLQ